MTEKKENSHAGITVSLVILWVIVVFLLGSLIYVYFINRTLRKAGAQTVSIEDPGEVIRQVGELMTVPTDETPTVALISDVSKLKMINPIFYENVENGDILIVYTSVTVIYRQTENKIVNAAPVFIHDSDEKYP